MSLRLFLDAEGERHCQTIYKGQGLTSQCFVVVSPSTNKPLAMGVEYVAFSRVEYVGVSRAPLTTTDAPEPVD